MEEVILVDEQDQELGTMEKMEAHEKGALHRAFSVFLYNDKGELLLQQRALHKYHSGGLWTNTCCSHPRPGEAVVDAGKRRLKEEMGMTAEIEPGFSFVYRAELDHGLTEHELDHVLIGRSNEAPNLNPEEVENWKYEDPETIRISMEENPELYTAWFRICFDEVERRRQAMLT